MKSRPVSVIGGGISGLSAAYELHRRGVPFQLFEASERFGGILRTDIVNDLVIDAGPDAMLARKPAGIELCRDLGIAGRLIAATPPRAAFVVREGRLEPIKPLRIWGGPSTSAPASPKGSPRQYSIADYFRERFSPEALDYYAEPVLAGIHAGDVERLSMNALFPELMTGASPRREPDPQGEFRSFPRGMQELVDALVSALPREALHVSTAAPPIDDLLAEGPVIVATPAHAASRLFEPIDAELASLCRAVRYVSSGIVVLAYPRAAVHHSLQGSGFVVPRAERTFRILAATWLSSKWPGRAPDDVALLRAFFGGARDPRAMDLSDDGAIAMAHEDLSRLLAIDVSPSLARVYRWPDGTPQYEVDYPARLQAIRSRLAGHARLFVTGAGFGQIGIPDCIADGRAIGARAADQ